MAIITLKLKIFLNVKTSEFNITPELLKQLYTPIQHYKITKLAMFILGKNAKFVLSLSLPKETSKVMRTGRRW